MNEETLTIEKLEVGRLYIHDNTNDDAEPIVMELIEINEEGFPTFVEEPYFDCVLNIPNTLEHIKALPYKRDQSWNI